MFSRCRRGVRVGAPRAGAPRVPPRPDPASPSPQRAGAQSEPETLRRLTWSVWERREGTGEEERGLAGSGAGARLGPGRGRLGRRSPNLNQFESGSRNGLNRPAAARAGGGSAVGEAGAELSPLSAAAAAPRLSLPPLGRGGRSPPAPVSAGSCPPVSAGISAPQRGRCGWLRGPGKGLKHTPAAHRRSGRSPGPRRSESLTNVRWYHSILQQFGLKRIFQIVESKLSDCQDSTKVASNSAKAKPCLAKHHISASLDHLQLWTFNHLPRQRAQGFENHFRQESLS